MEAFFNLQTEVLIGDLSGSGLGKLLTETYGNRKKIVLVDSYTVENCLPVLINFIDGLEAAEIIEIPAGEENKTLDICTSVWESLTDYEVSRNDLFICLGGGMVCDMGGFIAALYKRGMDCLYIPTSLLGMVDASIGGKTGVDMGPFKNQIGAFSLPKKVYVDPAFLETLPQNEIQNGLAEMLKHGLIADKNHFEQIEKYVSGTAIPEEWIARSLHIKSEIVESDPTESGRRKLLNFGHTIGHAIEGSLLNTETPMDHGLAVAHGMLVEAKISECLQLISSEEFQRIENCLRKMYQFRSFGTTSLDEWMQLMRQDKKRFDDQLRFTLLTGIGQADWDVAVDQDLVCEACGELF
jgi:3-dehydroquinate synthase